MRRWNMADTPTTIGDSQVACDICMKEIPVTEARSEEADDYVRHFCGLECYGKWRAQQEETGEGDADGGD
jgi:hypothetical protein